MRFGSFLPATTCRIHTFHVGMSSQDTSFENRSASRAGAEPSPRAGAALCLSGGGYRATLFHIGALRRLNECGLLGWLDSVVSVSGGSFTAAHIARKVSPWPRVGEAFPDWENTVAAPLRAFCRVDVRTPAAWQGLTNPLRLWNQGGFPAQLVEEAVRRFLHPGSLSDLPEHPRFTIQASDVDRGTLFRFERDRLVRGARPYATRPTDTIARAVAASACFPPVFAPVPASDEPGRFSRKGASGPVLLSDGGLYDNLGLQPAIQNHKHVLISDAGAPWDYSVQSRGLGMLIGRYPTVLMRQVQNLRMREWISLRDNKWLHPARRIEGAWWSLTSPKPSTLPNEGSSLGPRPQGYPDEFLEAFVVNCRTDLNSFSTAEAIVLENAGYMHCAIALHDRFTLPPGLPAPPAPQWPHPQVANAAEASRFLGDTANRMPGGWWRFLEHMMREHDLPTTLPQPDTLTFTHSDDLR